MYINPTLNTAYRSSSSTLGFVSADLQKQGPELALHKAVYDAMVREYNGGRPLAVELTTFCDAPAGSGLGASSTLVVVMLLLSPICHLH